MRIGRAVVRLDDPDDLARNHIRFQPVVLRSLLGAGFRRLGDLRWVPSRELMNLHYIGFNWAAQIRTLVRRFERGRAGGDSLILTGVSPQATGRIMWHRARRRRQLAHVLQFVGVVDRRCPSA